MAGLSTLEAGRRRTDFWALWAARRPFIEDGSTWTGSKEGLAREVERANISGMGLLSATDAAAFAGTAEQDELDWKFICHEFG